MNTHPGWVLAFSLAVGGCSSGDDSNGVGAPVGTAHPTSDAAMDGASFPLPDAARDAGEHDAHSPIPTELDAAGCTPIDGKTHWGTTAGTVTGGRETFDCSGTPGAPIDKTCARDEDCVVVKHRYDPCAGSSGPGFAFVGINIGDHARFDAAEAACQWPPRACAGGWWIAEDGTILNGTATLQAPRVSCCGGLCRATLMPHLLDAGHTVTDDGGYDGAAHSAPVSGGRDGSGGAERDAQSDSSPP